MKNHPLFQFIQEHLKKDRIHLDFMALFKQETLKFTDRNKRVTPYLQEVLYLIEAEYFSDLNQELHLEFQEIIAELGAKMNGKIILPKSQTPFWLLDRGEFFQYRSTPELPKKVAYVVIGAGITGTSAAYHLSQSVPAGKEVVLLEADQPASQSSGKNGGNFQLLPESYVDHYTGMINERIKGIKQFRPWLSDEEVEKIALRQAQVLLRFSFQNYFRFRELVNREQIQCDFSPAGWLRIASSAEEEAALLSDFVWMKSLSETDLGGSSPHSQICSPDEIWNRWKISSHFSGRHIDGSGNYHPYKYVVELLKRALSKGVKFYSGISVLEIVREADHSGKGILIHTSQGTIEAEQVIVATNALTSRLFSDLSAIQCVPSQIMNMEHILDPLRGVTATELQGDIYYNFPKSRQYLDEQGNRRGMIHFGLDFHHIAEDPLQLPRSEVLFQEMKLLTDERFPDTIKQPASRVWTGPMAFTPDRLPVIAFHYSKERVRSYPEIVIAAGFQGYGGSYCTHAGFVAAEMAQTRQVHPDAPEDVFSAQRYFLSD